MSCLLRVVKMRKLNYDDNWRKSGGSVKRQKGELEKRGKGKSNFKRQKGENKRELLKNGFASAAIGGLVWFGLGVCFSVVVGCLVVWRWVV